jgi:hypothetical protein
MRVFPDCESDPAVPATVTPREVAQSHWSDLDLPTPQVSIPPGNMIVGIPAYLVTDSPFTLPFAETTVFDDLRIETASHLVVDWGDGTVTGPHTEPGRPHPVGGIEHVYQRHGTYDVTVTQVWTGTWRWGDDQGPLPERRVSTTIADYPVREIQAVLDN